MKLIKIGAAYINMDLVTDIWVGDGRVSVFMAVPVMYTPLPFQGTSNAITTRELQFTGEDAVALINWLENKSKAKDLTPNGHTDSDGASPESPEVAVWQPAPSGDEDEDTLPY